MEGALQLFFSAQIDNLHNQRVDLRRKRAAFVNQDIREGMVSGFSVHTELAVFPLYLLRNYAKYRPPLTSRTWPVM